MVRDPPAVALGPFAVALPLHGTGVGLHLIISAVLVLRVLALIFRRER